MVVINIMIQSILFDKKYWNFKDAVDWLDEHKHIFKKIDTTDNYYRFRQRRPNKKKNYYTETLPNHVKLIIYY